MRAFLGQVISSSGRLAKADGRHADSVPVSLGTQAFEATGQADGQRTGNREGGPDATVDRRAFLTSTALGAAAASIWSREVAAAAAVPLEPIRFYSLQLGEFEIVPLCDGAFVLPLDSLATNVDKAVRKTYFDANYMSAEKFQLQLTPLLISTRGKNMLVDTGPGPGQDWAPDAGRLARSLQSTDLLPAEIHIIILTHGHGDHVGGL